MGTTWNNDDPQQPSGRQLLDHDQALHLLNWEPKLLVPVARASGWTPNFEETKGSCERVMNPACRLRS